MKAIALSINMIVFLAVAVLVLAAVSFFFASSASQFGSESEARAYISSACPQLRCGYETSAVLKKDYQKFYEACKSVVGTAAEEKPYLCLELCGCSSDVSEEAVQEHINEFVSQLQKPE